MPSFFPKILNKKDKSMMILTELNSISLKIIHMARIPFHKSVRLFSTSVINCIFLHCYQLYFQ